MHYNTVSRAECGGDVSRGTLLVLKEALEVAGVEFTDGDAPGVRLRHADVPAP